MRTIEDHRQEVTALVTGSLGPLEAETLAVSGTALTADPHGYEHRVLAHDVLAPSSLPAFDNSQMDGYAVIAAELASASADRPVTLAVARRVAAGDPFSQHRPRTATPVMTGAPIPVGADAVVQIERADPPVFPTDDVVLGAGGSDLADGGTGDGGLADAGTGTGDLAYTGTPADGGVPGSGGAALAAATNGGIPGADGAAPALDAPAPAHRVAFTAPVAPGTFVRAAGSDVTAGQTLLHAGTTLGPAHYGVIAGTGATEVAVRRRPRVLLVSTGHEIRDPGSTLAPGQIFDANTVALTSALQGIGCAVTAAPCRSDDADDLLRLLADHASGTDLVVTVGGVSAGAREVVRDALGPLGVSFMKVAMQPGGPQGFGLARIGGGERDGTPANELPVVCLPGNPVSALVSFEAFLRPALLAALGATTVLREQRRGRAAHPFDSPATHHQLRRARVLPDGTLELVGGPSSHLLHSYAESTALVHVPLGISAVAAGDELDYWRIDG
ncbi:molybdopterin molybdotransferase MoeA [Herbiconiux sp. 11R-BC]|uniref:molybdopterin molybdotransferase MoeA n=1 Tax=Herbiconiux sp. 11R-BC TaxID=3111637 RepID=UPI003C10FF72